MAARSEPERPLKRARTEVQLTLYDVRLCKVPACCACPCVSFLCWRTEPRRRRRKKKTSGLGVALLLPCAARPYSAPLQTIPSIGSKIAFFPSVSCHLRLGGRTCGVFVFTAHPSLSVLLPDLSSSQRLSQLFKRSKARAAPSQPESAAAPAREAPQELKAHVPVAVETNPVPPNPESTPIAASASPKHAPASPEVVNTLLPHGELLPYESFEEVRSFLELKQHFYAPNPDCLMRHPEIKPRMRSVLMDWLIEVRSFVGGVGSCVCVCVCLFLFRCAHFCRCPTSLCCIERRTTRHPTSSIATCLPRRAAARAKCS
jgi:hypothetical protein